jgi:protocatechuate 3,4-dioxygenase beta subunit
MILEITPSHGPAAPLTVKPGEQIQFSATAWEWTSAGLKQQVQIDQLSWDLDPAAFGSITSGGLLTAAAQNSAPRGVVIATAQIGAVTIRSDVVVMLGNPAATHTFKGSVSDASGPVAEARVSVMSVGMLPFLVTGKTDANGAFSIDVPGGTYVVRAEASGYIPEFFDDVLTQDKATEFVTDPAVLTIDNIDFVLSEGGKIRGTITDAATNAPLEGALVFAMDGTNRIPPSGSNAGYHARSDAQGNYEITGLPDGDYVVSAQAQKYIQQFYDGKTDPGSADEVTISSSSTATGIDFALSERQPDPVYTIEGSVHDNSSTPVEGAIVYAEMRNGPMLRWLQTRSRSDGSYTLEVPAGTFIVWAMKQGLVTEYYDNVSDAAQATTLTLDANNTSQTGIDFALDTFGGSIAGVVRDANGNPVADAVVRAWANQRPMPNSTGHGFGTARSASDGSYVIAGLPPADYVVRAQAKDFLPEYYDDVTDMSAATQVTVANQAVTGIDFSLSQGGSISGRITDEDTGDPLAHAVVFVRSTAHRFERGARTDASGDYTVHGLPSGDYTVFSAARGYLGEYYDDAATAAAATPVTVSAPSAVTGIDLALATAPVAPRSYRGQVTSRGGVPAHVLVEAVNPVSGMTMRSTTDMRGGFELQAWENAVIRVRALGYIGQYAGGTHDWKQSRWEGLTGTMTFMLETQSEAGMAEVSGTIRDASSNEGLADAWVYGMDAAGNVFFSVTGGDGGYLIPNATNGSLDIMVSEVGYETTHGGTSVEDARGSADISAQRSSVTDVDDSPALPISVRLYQNYPNPFNPSTTLRFDLPDHARVTLRVYDLLGREVATLLRGTVDAGSHTVAFDAAGLPSGLYLARLESGGVVQTRRMTLMK